MIIFEFMIFVYVLKVSDIITKMIIFSYDHLKTSP